MVFDRPLFVEEDPIDQGEEEKKERIGPGDEILLPFQSGEGDDDMEEGGKRNI